MEKGSEEQNFDRSAEIIGERVAHELGKFQDQVINTSLIETVRDRVAQSIGGLVGVTEIANIFGVTRQRASQIHNGKTREPLPTPIAHLAGTPVWFKSDIEDFSARRGAKK